MMEDLTDVHEWELACRHKEALELEDYETCESIQAEVNRRISEGVIDQSLMDGFRYYDPNASKFEGKPKYKGLNGLFDDYKNK